MFNKKGVSYGGQQRSKSNRTIFRRRHRAASLGGVKSSAQTSPNSRGDEDSGFGGDSLEAELSLGSSPLRHSTSPLSSHRGNTTLCAPSNNCNSVSSSCGTSNSCNTSSSYNTSSSCGISSNFSRIVLPRFGVSEELFADDAIGVRPKRLRLDMTEEANELPEEKGSTPQYTEGGGGPKIVSFKNVPGLIFPANAVQVQPATTLLSISSHQQPIQAPKQIVVEQAKQKLVATCKGGSKGEKITRKKGKGHLLEGTLPSISSDRSCELQLLTQPEGQHRARYQTEGSRGAVKDRAGTGHPCVKLKGYYEDAVLQVFVASDGVHGGQVTPHLFYQACKVSGKNSTPCNEERVHGTTVLEIALQPDKDMTVNCDCVGILKERNVDVEQKLKAFVSRGKKKSTKCRLVFRTKVALGNGVQEILQVVSQPISCTQPPGVPEISRKSRSSCMVEGKEEMFIIGKNFYKDAEVIFREVNEQEDILWSSSVVPEKDFLQSNHLICQIPPYQDKNLDSELEVQVVVVSCNKVSDPHPFTYLPRKKEVEERQSAVQRHPLPKGVNPSAVKLNQLYAESGALPFSSRESGALPFSSREYFHFPNSLMTNPVQRNDNKTPPSLNKELAIIPPLQVNRVLAAVKPQVQAISSTVPKFTHKIVHNNTLTTATVQAPKLSPNSVPSSHVPVGDIEGKVKKECSLEDLVQMLKLLKSFPGKLQFPIMGLVADELNRQVKKGSVDGSVIEKENAFQSHILSESSPYLYDTKSGTQQKLSNSPKDVFISTVAGSSPKDVFISTVAGTSPEAASKVYSFNAYNMQCSELAIPNSTGTSEPIHTFDSVAMPQPQDKRVLSQGTNGVYPVATNFFTSGEPKGEFSNVVFTTSQNSRAMVQTLCQSSPSLVLNVAESQSNKVDYLATLNSMSHHQSGPTGQQSESKIEIKRHDRRIDSMLESDYKMISQMQNHNTSLSLDEGEVKREDNLLQNEECHSRLLQNLGGLGGAHSGKNLSFHEPSFVLDNSMSTNTNMDTALSFKIEHCDPLLSQANAVSNMALHNTDELSSSLGAPVGEHPSSESARMISQTINQGGTNEVPISNFSESELLDYINPICFENV